MQAVHGYSEQVLLLSSINLLLYWLIYGVILAIRSVKFDSKASHEHM
jgi:hypothetical protein